MLCLKHSKFCSSIGRYCGYFYLRVRNISTYFPSLSFGNERKWTRNKKKKKKMTEKEKFSSVFFFYYHFKTIWHKTTRRNPPICPNRLYFYVWNMLWKFKWFLLFSIIFFFFLSFCLALSFIVHFPFGSLLSIVSLMCLTKSILDYLKTPKLCYKAIQSTFYSIARRTLQQ